MLSSIFFLIFCPLKCETLPFLVMALADHVVFVCPLAMTELICVSLGISVSAACVQKQRVRLRCQLIRFFQSFSQLKY